MPKLDPLTQKAFSPKQNNPKASDLKYRNRIYNLKKQKLYFFLKPRVGFKNVFTI